MAQPTGRNAAILVPIRRSIAREAEKIICKPEFGFDLWTLWELSWLNDFGVPEVFVGRLKVPLESENICESKSLKLYLNGLSHEYFPSPQDFKNTVVDDLKAVLGVPPSLEVYSLASFEAEVIFKPVSVNNFGTSLDRMNVRITKYFPDENLLEVKENSPCNTGMFTQLFRSNCPVTNQPDWATVGISYSSEKTLVPESLLTYLISFRNHNGFHLLHCYINRTKNFGIKFPKTNRFILSVPTAK